ncbi:MAG: DMT family transporter [Bacteroidota bacterium]
MAHPSFRLNKQGILFGVLGVVLFSTKAIWVKLAYQYDIDTLTLLLFRMLFSLPCYIFLLWLHRKKPQKKVTFNDAIWILIFGCLGYYLSSYFDFLGLNYIKAGLERIILFSYPTLVVLFGYLFFKERLQKMQAVAIAMTYVGICITFWGEVRIANDKTLFGALLIGCSAITYAAYLVGSGWLLPKYGVLRFPCYAMIVSTFGVLAHYSFKGDWDLWHFSKEVYGYAIIMAIVATVIPSFLVAAAIKKIGASNFSILGSLGPVSTIIMAYFILNEALTILQLIGMLVVIFGVTSLSFQKKKG